ncbi:SDR family oxidoreductase [Catellatospora coxensis]
MTTLITGADGYLGRRIVAALRGEDLILAVRCADQAELDRKRALLARVTDAPVVPADLRDDDPFAHVDPRSVTRIVHAAAVIRFDVSRDTADRVNASGTARVREFARRCDRLDRLMLLSTLYSAGRRRGEVHETRHDDAGFVNHYEWSKWAAEECLLDAPGLPVTVVRLPTLIAEDGGGEVGQYNAFHHTMRLYHSGLLTLLPGDPATPLSLATAEFTVAGVTALLTAPPGIYQLCPGPVTLGTAIDTAFAVFEQDPGFRRRMLPAPSRATGPVSTTWPRPPGGCAAARCSPRSPRSHPSPNSSTCPNTSGPTACGRRGPATRHRTPRPWSRPRAPT